MAPQPIPPVITRLYTSADLNALYAIEQACFAPPVRFSRDLMRSLAEDPHCRTWMGMVDGISAGFAIVSLRSPQETVAEALMGSASVLEKLHPEATAYLWTIEVLPAFRRLGVARQLLERVESSAAQAGCEVLDLHVSERNHQAAALYKSRGYEPVSIAANYYSRGENGLRYRKRLASNPA